MIKELLHPIALDENGSSVHVSIAEKGKKYFCPFCKKKLIFNRSLKSGKGSRRAHFSHENLSPNCTAEGYLHSTFKIMLLENLNRSLASKTPFFINYVCNVCMNEHKADLLTGAIAVTGEYDLKVCRPDIALISNDNRVYAVIEIVVTHEPEENALKYFMVNQIVLIKIKLETDDDLLDIEKKAKNPTQVLLTNKGQCPIFLEKQRQIKLKNMNLQKQNRTIGYSGPRIDQIEAKQALNDRKRYFAIKNNYKKKKR